MGIYPSANLHHQRPLMSLFCTRLCVKLSLTHAIPYLVTLKGFNGRLLSLFIHELERGSFLKGQIMKNKSYIWKLFDNLTVTLTTTKLVELRY